MFTEERIKTLLQKLKSSINKKSVKLEGFKYAECDYFDIGKMPEDKALLPYNGETWGKDRDSHVWFCKDIKVPNGFDLNNTFIRVDTCENGWFWGNPQFIVYVDKKIKHALDYKHWDFAVENKKFNLALYGYVGKYIAGGNEEESIIQGDIIFNAYLIEKDKITEKLFYDLFVPFSALNCLDKNSKDYNEILVNVTNALDFIDFRNIYSNEYYSSVEKAQEYIDGFYKKQKAQNKGLVSLIGQTHIDVAWLWTKRQVREKAIRSFTTALELLDKYPDYKFMMCQPALYEFVKEDAPELYEKIKQKVKEGRWEVNGGLYVENDFNLTNGESIVRQLFYADKFFKEEFGKKSNVAWVPDSFGFSGSIPQIFKKAGIDFFITSKLSWNEKDTMPYDSFNWKGIDGTSVMAYLLTAQDKRFGITPARFTIYNAVLSVPQVMGTFERYQQKDLNDNVVLTYGFGDGGGGPTAEYLEVMDRLNKGINGVPATESAFLGDFVDKTYKKLKDKKNLPTWSGELYFERHRGVYTSVAKMKKNNRKAEFELKNAEQLSVIASDKFNIPYPEKELEDSWKKVLTNQFHDVLPGSSIKEVYDEADSEYKKVFADLSNITGGFYNKVASAVDKKKFIAFNNNDGAFDINYADYNGKCVIIPNVQPNGYSVIDKLDDKCTVKCNGKVLENENLKVVFDSNYNVAELFDKKANRNIVKENSLFNQLFVFENLNGVYDAWEVSPYYAEKKWTVDNVSSVKTFTEGVRRGFIVKRKYMSSVITQKISLNSYGDTLDFDTTIDWHEDGALLKAKFPMDINFTKTVSDIQFGLIERGAEANTSWDLARFEFCAQKFIDVSEGGYGVSLINDCKYGHDCCDGVLGISLIKSSSFPSKGIDEGISQVKYSIYPHQSTLNENTVKKAYLLNNPVTLIKGTGDKTTVDKNYSLVKTNCENVFISAVKKADSNNDVIVRAYEGLNKYSSVKFTFGFKPKKVYLCNLLEKKESELQVSSSSVSLNIKPFEIITLRIVK